MNLPRSGGRRRLLLRGTFVGALSLLVLSADAQENTAKPATSAVSPPVTPKSSAPKTPAPAPSKRSLAPRPRGETPPALAANPAARTATATSTGSAASAGGGDGTEGEDPLVLQKMTVTEEQANLPSKPEVLDAQARLELALKAYPGLRIGGPLAKLNHAVALEMQKEAKEAAARAALAAHVENLPAMDEERAKEEVRLMREATARPNNDWRQRR